MTTPESMPGEPTAVFPRYSQPPPVPGYPNGAAPLPPQPPLPRRPMGLALAALIVGIAGFLVGLVPVFGALVGIAAVILGVLALSKRQPKGLATAGVVLGGVAILASVAMTIGIGAAVNNSSGDRPVIAATQPADSQPAETMNPKTSEAAKPPVTAAPVVKPAPPAPVVPAVPAEYTSALTKAKTYSDLMHMSKAGLYEQLTSEYGEKFSAEAAQYAVDTVQADWNANALAKAKSYQELMAMSPDAIYEQLTSEYGEQFTAEQADFALLHLND